MLSIEDLEKFCEGKEFKLSEHAPKILQRVVLRGGHCPCQQDLVPCPCPTHAEDIAAEGHCHCSLFVKR